jgi:hypothetical protein
MTWPPNSFDQTPDGYYYAPYLDNGPLQQRFQHYGEVAAAATLGFVGPRGGWPEP